MAGDTVIELRPLRIGQRCGVGLEAFPDSIEQFSLLRRGEAVYLASQIAHMPTNLARFPLSDKHTTKEIPRILFHLRRI
jgi:hypothetical protein